MFRKKVMVMGIGVFLAAAMYAVPVYAHGGHHQTAENRCAAGTEGRMSTGCTVRANDETWADNTEAHCPVCLVDGCAETGHHLHDQVVYCGYPHEHGYCDGSCANSLLPNIRFHGRHH